MEIHQLITKIKSIDHWFNIMPSWNIVQGRWFWCILDFRFDTMNEIKLLDYPKNSYYNWVFVSRVIGTCQARRIASVGLYFSKMIWANRTLTIYQNTKHGLYIGEFKRAWAGACCWLMSVYVCALQSRCLFFFYFSCSPRLYFLRHTHTHTHQVTVTMCKKDLLVWQFVISSLCSSRFLFRADARVVGYGCSDKWGESRQLMNRPTQASATRRWLWLIYSRCNLVLLPAL